MKKNKMMRFASALLVLTLLTTCAISGTFAKYVTQDSGSDSARVAKFGVTIEVTDEDGFAKEYAKDNEYVVAAFANSVVSSTDDDVVAPGTSGTLASYTITGTPEVATTEEVTGTLTLSGWTDADGGYYCPIKITVNDTTFEGLDYDSAEAFKAAVEGAVTGSANHEPGYTYKNDIDVSWEWVFEGNDDVKDTYLGDQAAAGNAAVISFGVDVKVTQID